MRLNDPTNNKIVRKSVSESAYITDCKVCERGIFEDEPTVWGRGRYLGLCHEECLQGLVAEAVLLS